MWRDELKRAGKDGASLSRVFWRFCQTRMMVAVFALLLTMVACFVGPVSTPDPEPNPLPVEQSAWCLVLG